MNFFFALLSDPYNFLILFFELVEGFLIIYALFLQVLTFVHTYLQLLGQPFFLLSYRAHIDCLLLVLLKLGLGFYAFVNKRVLQFLGGDVGLKFIFKFDLVMFEALEK